MADIDAAAVRVPVGLPSAVERRLLDVVADGFVLCCCGGRVEPTALIAFYEWEHCIDLVTIRGFDRVTTGRVPKHGKVDVFAPEVVVWTYEGPAEPALRALLNLVHPEHPDAPTALVASTWHHAPCKFPDTSNGRDDPTSFSRLCWRPSRSARRRDSEARARLVQPNPG